MKKIVTTTKVLICVLSLVHTQAYCQSGNDKSNDVVSKLKTFSETHISEKAYLHFDKPYYAAGDTVYFKAYLTMGERHQFSKISGILYADLINSNNKIDQSIKLQVKNGVAWGDFALPDSLPKGNYRVRAYTNWMRNDGDDSYFYQTMAVGSNKIPESGSRHATRANAKPDVQFFPEGGELITGISSKIAFKATGTNGLGIDVKGIVADETGNEVTNFTTAHMGMGYFNLKPEPGKIYTARITYANGAKDNVNIAPAAASGVMLKINNESLDKAGLQIAANENYFAENHDRPISLLVYSGGIATMITTKLDSMVINLAILKRHLHSGITRVTLFSAVGEPLSERLIFIQNPDQLKLTLNTNKTVYNRREKVSFGINAVNRADSAITGHFSISVIDESKVQSDENSENTILTCLLLTSELKGYIEQPNYYFTNTSDKTKADLDLVMLTHGYRKFEWKQLLNDKYPPIANQPERDLEITGIAKSLGGKPLANATVSLISMHGGAFTASVTDDKGQFRFSRLLFPDTAKFVLQAVNAKGGRYTKLFYNESGPLTSTTVSPVDNDISQLMAAYMENNKKLQDDMIRYNDVNNKRLKEVFINDKKIRHYPSNGNLISPEMADQLATSEDLQRAGGVSLNDMLLQKFYGRGRHAGLIVLDGVPMPPAFNVDDLNATDIETVGAVYGVNTTIYGVRGGGGIWLITTKQGKGLDKKDIASIGVLPISPKGLYKARQFYAPKYDYADPANNRADLRSTIFWKPELITDKDGNASFEYYNADGSGNYRVVVEGIDEKGNLGRQVYRYKVE